MYKRIKRATGTALAVIGAFTVFLIPVSAQNVDSANFTVEAVIPENQIDKGKSYFDLMMKPGETQILKVTVYNTGNEEVIADVLTRAASTNRNGIIEYQVDTPPDETLKIPFNTIAETAPEIRVPPNSNETVDITVTMPKESFDGTILGGIVITKRGASKAVSGVSINNQFAYVIGVKLSETDKEVLPGFFLKSVEPGLVNYRGAVIANIQNPVPLIIKGAEVTAYIYKKNETKPLFSVSKTGVDMAPNSVYPLPIEWEGQKMDKGDYRMDLKLSYDGKITEWNEDFSITSSEAGTINKNAPSVSASQRSWRSWLWVPCLVIAVAALIWVAFLLGRKRQKEDK